MDLLFFNYRDPLVGLIFIVFLIFVVALGHFFWQLFARRGEQDRLAKFINAFELNSEHKKLLEAADFELEKILFLAASLARSGDYERAAQLYQLTLKRRLSRAEEASLLLELARTYFRAGFLERAREALLNILASSPRNLAALSLLKIILLRLKDYPALLDLLGCLAELGSVPADSLAAELGLIRALKIHAEPGDPHTRLARLAPLAGANNFFLQRWLFENYSLVPGQAALARMGDLLYKNQNLRALAAGELVSGAGGAGGGVAEGAGESGGPDAGGSGEAEAIDLLLALDPAQPQLQMLKILRSQGFAAGLAFSYFCQGCKATLPLFFYHCPLCYDFGTCQVLCEVKSEKN